MRQHRDERFRLLFRAKPHPRASTLVGLNRAAVENTVLSALHIIYCGASLYCFSFPQASAAPPPNLQARTPSKLFGFVFACKFALFSPPYKKRPCFPSLIAPAPLILACGSQAVRSPAPVHSPHHRDERFRLLFRAKPHPRASTLVGLNRAAVENTVLSALHIIYCGASLYCFSFPQASAAPPPNLQARTPSKLFGFVLPASSPSSPRHTKKALLFGRAFFVWWG